jgi:hypothetical protein
MLKVNSMWASPLGMKRCRGCWKTLPISEFHYCSKAKDNLKAQCKSCRKKERKIEKPILSSCVSLVKVTDLFKPCNRCLKVLPMGAFSSNLYCRNGKMSFCRKCGSEKWQEHGKEAGREVRTLHRKNNEEKYRERRTTYHKTHLEAENARGRDYGKKHRRESSARQKQRLKDDPNFKLICNLRGRLTHAIKDGQKGGSAIDDLSCSIEALWSWFSGWYHSGMTRDNRGGRGGWQIDHVIPLSAFNLGDRKECLLANHYTNLRPILPKDNASKHDYVPTFLVQPISFCGMMIAVALDENNQAVMKCFK